MTNSEKVIKRRFVIEKLPDPLSPADDHLQIFENYVGNTRLRLKSERRPSTDERSKYLEQREPSGSSVTAVHRLLLNAEEYEALRPLRGREIRKNRYSLSKDSTDFEIDVYLGSLWGLNTASVRFASIADAEAFEPPAFCLAEVTENPAFDGRNLVDLGFEDVRREFAKAKGGDS